MDILVLVPYSFCLRCGWCHVFRSFEMLFWSFRHLEQSNTHTVDQLAIRQMLGPEDRCTPKPPDRTLLDVLLPAEELPEYRRRRAHLASAFSQVRLRGRQSGLPT